MEAMAIEMGARGDLIAKIREGSIEQLKAARMELMNMKNVDKEKLSAIDSMIIAAENEAASMAKISKKTQSQITSIEKEEADKRKAIRDKAEADKKKAHEDELARIKKEREAYLDRIIAGRLGEEEQKNIDERRKESIKSIDPVVQGSAEIQLQSIGAVANANNEAQTKKAKQDKEQADGVMLYEQQKRDTYKMTGDTLGALGDLVGKQTIAGKALAISQALINTYLGVTEVLRNKTIIPEPFGTIQKVASVATILASGFSAVRNIGRTQVPGGGGGGAAAPTMSSIPAPVSPQATATTLSSSTIQNIGNAAAGGVNRAYVLDSDIRNSDERNTRLQRAARLG